LMFGGVVGLPIRSIPIGLVPFIAEWTFKPSRKARYAARLTHLPALPNFLSGRSRQELPKKVRGTSEFALARQNLSWAVSRTPPFE